jgi:hypothetical protein
MSKKIKLISRKVTFFNTWKTRFSFTRKLWDCGLIYALKNMTWFHIGITNEKKSKGYSELTLTLFDLGVSVSNNYSNFKESKESKLFRKELKAMSKSLKDSMNVDLFKEGE